METKRSGIREALSFASGGMINDFEQQIISIFMLMFFTDVLGIPAATAGVIYTAGFICGAVTDVIIGYIADWGGRYRRWILGGTIASAVALAIMFTHFHYPEHLKALFAFLTFALWSTTFSAYIIPYNAYGATVTTNVESRANLNGVRYAILAIPTIAMAIATPYLVNARSNGSYSTVAVIFGAICIGIAILFYAGTKDHAAVKKGERVRFLEGLKALVQNRQLLVMFFGVLFYSLIIVYYSAMSYVFTYVYESAELMSVVEIISIPAGIICALLVGPISKRIGKKKFFVICILAFIASMMVLYFVRSSTPVILLCHTVMLIATSFTPVIMEIMKADAMDYGVWTTGKNTRAFSYSFFTVARKIAVGFSGTIIGLVLTRFDFVPNATQTARSLDGIMTAYCIIPSVFVAVCLLLIVFGYQLNEQRMKQIGKELSERGLA